MKVLITGGAGFIGRWLLAALPEDANVVVVDVLDEQIHGPEADFPADVLARATCFRCDVREVDRWKHAAAGADAVIHLAALTGTGQSMCQSSRYIEHNVLATRRLFEALAGFDPRPRRVILASSRAVYGEGAFRAGGQLCYPGPRRAAALAAGRWEAETAGGAALDPAPVPEDAPLLPTSVYGLTKMWQEQLLVALSRTHGIEHAILRLQNVYGPLQSLENPHTGIIAQFASRIVRSDPVELFEDGGMTRDFVFVGDVARAILAAVEHQGPLACTLNVGSGRAVSLRDLTRSLAEIAGKELLVNCSGRYRVGDVRHASADMKAYQAVFGPWQPVALADGLKQYLDWLAEQPVPRGNALAASLADDECHGLLLGNP